MVLDAASLEQLFVIIEQFRRRGVKVSQNFKPSNMITVKWYMSNDLIEDLH